MTQPKKRILFVDDELAILDGLRNVMFRERRRWDMVFALGAECALVEVRNCRFDAVVSDMRMPGMDGAELLSAIQRESPATARIMLSGQVDPEALARAHASVDELVTKPCDAATLRDVIERNLGRGESS